MVTYRRDERKDSVLQEKKIDSKTNRKRQMLTIIMMVMAIFTVGVIEATAEETGLSQLTGSNRNLYIALKTRIREVALGEVSSTVFSIPAEEIFEQCSFTAEDLGVEELGIYEEDENEFVLYTKTQFAFNNKLSELVSELDCMSVVDRLIADCPYNLYWFNWSYTIPKNNFDKQITDDHTAIRIVGDYNTTFLVYKDYATFTLSDDGEKVYSRSEVDLANMVTSVTITSPEEKLIVGRDYQLNATVTTRIQSHLMSTQTFDNHVVKFISSNPEIATVDNETGLVSAISPGIVTITAVSASNKSAAVELEVLDICVNHTAVIDPRVEPTCTETGLTEGSHCSVCGKIITEQMAIPLKEHTKIVDSPAVEPTCEQNGITEQSHCSECETILSEKEEIPSKGHMVVIDAAVEPTCTETGFTEGSHCSICGKILKEQEIIPIANHVVVIDPAVEATCSSTGLTEGRHCSACGKVIMEQYLIPVKEHTKQIDSPAVEPTCERGGITEQSHCCVCGIVLSEKRMIPAKEHDIVIDPAVEATCTETGLTEGKHCSVCGEIIISQDITSAKGHLIVIDPAVEATENNDGLTEGSHCSICGKVIVEQRYVSKVYPVVSFASCFIADLPNDFSYTYTGDNNQKIYTNPDEADFIIMTGKTSDLLGEIGISPLPNSVYIDILESAGYTVIWSDRHPYQYDEYDHIFFDENGNGFVRNTSINCVVGHQKINDYHYFQGFVNLDNSSYYFVSCSSFDYKALGGCTIIMDSIREKHRICIDKAKIPTEYEYGLTEGKHCSNCGAVLVKQEMIPASSNVLNLPQMLQTVENEAFANMTMEIVIIPDNCKSIGSRAFANCKQLRYVWMPRSGIRIAGDAFDECGDVTIYNK